MVDYRFEKPTLTESLAFFLLVHYIPLAMDGIGGNLVRILGWMESGMEGGS